MPKFYFCGELERSRQVKAALRDIISKHNARDLFPDMDFSYPIDYPPAWPELDEKFYEIEQGGRTEKPGILNYLILEGGQERRILVNDKKTPLSFFEAFVRLGRFDENSEVYKSIYSQLEKLLPEAIDEFDLDFSLLTSEQRPEWLKMIEQ